MAPRGTYTLVIELPSPWTIAVGALGERRFAAGWYAYTGSALGPGGLSRADRHHDVARGANDARHWHVDYLLGETAARIAAVGWTPGRDVECVVSGTIGGDAIPGFGASDCACQSHLRYRSDRERLVTAVCEAHGGAGGDPECGRGPA